MPPNRAQRLGPRAALRDIAALLLISGCASAPEHTDLLVTFVGQPPRARRAELSFTLFVTRDARPCDELERLVVRQPPIPEVDLIGHLERSERDWPDSIALLPFERGGRVFGVVRLSDVPHATFCSEPVEPGAQEAAAAPVHLLRTRAGPPMHAPRARFTATALDGGRMLAAGGSRAGQVLEVYEPGEDAWRLLPASILPHRLHAAARLPGDRVLLIGGSAVSGTTGTPRVELIDAQASGDALIASMEVARLWAAATPLVGGEVLVTGGSLRTDAELFEPDAGAWRLTGAMKEVRLSHTATRLADGTVLLAGGIDLSGQPSATTELYEPLTGMFSDGPALSAPRNQHVAVVLADGSVLFAGGGGLNTERYLPATRAFVPAGALLLEEPNPCACLMPSGEVVLTGGSQLVQVFDPLENSWSARAVLSVPRDGCVAWPAADGGVMVSGGNDAEHHASTEVVQP